jgi:hypothetical protein
MLKWPNKKMFSHSILGGLLEEDKKIDLIIFWATTEEVF